MGLISFNDTNTQQNFYNQVNEITKNTCTVVTDQSISGQFIDVSNSTINGVSVGINTQNTVDASCVISSSMDSSVTNMLTSIVDQETKSESGLLSALTLSATLDKTNIVQACTNVINQINSATCTAASYNPIKDQYIYAANTTINSGNGTFLGISSNSNTSASCSMSNYMKSLSYNDILANSSEKYKSKGMFTTILTSIALIGGFLVLFMIVVGLIGGGGYIILKSSGNKK